MRIVSLVPSLSKTVADLGLRQNLCGITKFCIDPPDLHRTAKIIGGTKDPDLSLIRSLEPTHIIVNEEENKPEHIEELQTFAKVLNTFPKKLSDTPKLFQDLGDFLSCKNKTDKLIQEFTEVNKSIANHKLSGSFLYFIWKNPYMIAGRDTYISDFLENLGLKNAYTGSERYPKVTVDEMKGFEPTQLFFSSEPFPFRKRDLETFISEWPNHPSAAKIDGRLCSWYGTVVLEALKEASKLLKSEENHLVARF